MVAKDLSYAIVLAGRWNPAILTPAWLASNLFQGNPKVNIEFSLNFDIPSRFRIENIIIAPALDRVIILSADNSDESLNRMEVLAIRLCTILTHTPFTAVGINFGYLETQNKDPILPLMNFDDTDAITEDGWTISSPSLKRTLVRDDLNLNLTINFDQEANFHFDFNYHYPVKTTAHVQAALEGKVLAYKNHALTLLQNLYTIQL